MQELRHRFRRFAWIAWFAVCAVVLAPVLAQALNPVANAALGICSVAAADGPSNLPRAPAGGMHFEHCPLCAHFGAAPALPAAQVAALQAPDGADFVVARFATAPRPLFAWAAAQPRGPPRG